MKDWNRKQNVSMLFWTRMDRTLMENDKATDEEAAHVKQLFTQGTL